jgi:hypothetical protein
MTTTPPNDTPPNDTPAPHLVRLTQAAADLSDAQIADTEDIDRDHMV